MFIKLSALLVHVFIAYGQGEKLDWDLAIVVENEIKLLSSNGSEIASRSEPFSSLKALVYDGVRDQFFVSDTDQQNDTIFSVRFNKQTDTTEPIIRDLPGDVQGFAVDPLDDVLYWSDSINHTINYVRLNETEYESKEYQVFNGKVPHAIVIDVCNRYIYYTNPSGNKPTIERMRLDKSEHDILVSNTIMSPVGLAIDYKDQRLYWADSRIGTAAGRIESINLDGRDRQLVIERNTMEPYGLAVDENWIYWTDTNNNVLYKFGKYTNNPYADPEKVVTFNGTPMGLVAKNYIAGEDCKNLSAVIKEYQNHKYTQLKALEELEEKEHFTCYNGGKMNGSRCICKRGFMGNYCEFSTCNSDYCLNGKCYLSRSGNPLCNCENGYLGNRCQKNICDDYCLNQGECTLTSTKNLPMCSCPESFIGSRCEYSQEICDFYCKDIIFSEKIELLCRCPEKNTSSILQSVLQRKSDILSSLQDPVVYLSFILLCCLVIIIVLLVYIRRIQKKRPRIKKRIIVNKNITPLTYRPQPNTEQCEITIENCCNMNICETPCFEPREDKKKLLPNMEGEDLY